MKIDRQDVLRYLGYKNQILDPATNALLDDAMALCEGIAAPRYVYSVFDLIHEPHGLLLGATGVRLEGQSIAWFLEGAHCCALFAATLGVEPEKHIDRLQHTDITAALILDACATAAIETFCDQAEREIRTVESKELCVVEGKDHPATRSRFSPGYGDLPIGLQPDILRLLDTGRKIGLYCNEQNILIPRKSVTAILGFYGGKADERKACAACGLSKACQFRKEN